MAIVVNHKLGKFTFPDDMPLEQINQKIVDAEAKYGEQYGIGETLYRAAERGLTDTARGIEEKFTGEIGQGISLFGLNDKTDLEKEHELRVMLEQNPVAGYGGYIGGSVLDPFTLPFLPAKLLKFGKPLVTGAAQGAAAGGIAGALTPTYEEYGDSIVTNIMAGAGLGTVVGGALGKFFPGMFEADGKMANEVNEAIEDVALSVEESVVRQRDYETTKIETIQDSVATPLPVKSGIDAEVTASATQTPIKITDVDPVKILEDELTPIAARMLPRKEEQTLRGTAESLQGQLDAATRVLGRRKTVAARAKAQETVDKIKTQLNRVQAKLKEQSAATRAQRNINVLKTGRIEKLNSEERARFESLRTENIAPFASRIPVRATTKEGEELVSTLAARTESRAQGEKFVYPNVTSARKAWRENYNMGVAEGQSKLSKSDQEESFQEFVADWTRRGFAPENAAGWRLNSPSVKPEPQPTQTIPTGLTPPRSAGAMGVDPGLRYQGFMGDVIPEGAAQRSAFTTRGEPQNKFDIGEERTSKFFSRLTDNAPELMIKARNEMYGRYSFDNVQERAVRLGDKILEDYNDLVEWIVNRGDAMLKPEELEILTPVLIEARTRMLDSLSILHSLKRKGELNSYETAKTVRDIEFYSKIWSLYEGQKTQISNSLKQFQRMKALLGTTDKAEAQAKEVTQLFMGVTC